MIDPEIVEGAVAALNLFLREVDLNYDRKIILEKLEYCTLCGGKKCDGECWCREYY